MEQTNAGDGGMSGDGNVAVSGRMSSGLGGHGDRIAPKAETRLFLR
jgi:hypothetical protein